ncbi:MAG: hypothetical protein H7Y01_03380 [Ferruginibacter sp.]|nr:hypothetical protein [Chitinophagaceae bacterium]
MRPKTLLLLSFTILLFSCDRNSGTKPEMREAWVPVYTTSTASIKTITAGPPRSTVNAGKIYTVGNIIYQVEQDSGIHVINYANPSSPQKLGFIRSFLCKEVSVKSGLIYTNNFSDLVVIDASSITSVREVARTPDVFPDLALQYPSKPNNSATIYFECPDPKKGIVIGWQKKTIDNAKCWR